MIYKKILLLFFTLILFYSCSSCLSNKKASDNVILHIDKIEPDTLHDGFTIAFRIRIDNNTDKDIEFFTGMNMIKDSITTGGFFIHCKKINKTYQLTVPYKNVVGLIPANTKNTKIYVDIGFAPFRKYVSEYKIIKDNYFTPHDIKAGVKRFLNDIEISYHVDKFFVGKTFQDIFINDTIIPIPIPNIKLSYYYDDTKTNMIEQTLLDP